MGITTVNPARGIRYSEVLEPTATDWFKIADPAQNSALGDTPGRAAGPSISQKALLHHYIGSRR